MFVWWTFHINICLYLFIYFVLFLFHLVFVTHKKVYNMIDWYCFLLLLLLLVLTALLSTRNLKNDNNNDKKSSVIIYSVCVELIEASNWRSIWRKKVRTLDGTNESLTIERIHSMIWREKKCHNRYASN